MEEIKVRSIKFHKMSCFLNRVFHSFGIFQKDSSASSCNQIFSSAHSRIEKFCRIENSSTQLYLPPAWLCTVIHTRRKCAELYKAARLKSDVRCTEIGNKIENIAYLAQRGTINIVSAPPYRCGFIPRYLLSVSNASYPVPSNEGISKCTVKQPDKPCR